MNASAFKRGDYYCISYPREQRVFEDPKIVLPQRSPQNTFAYNTVPWCASADVYFILKKSSDYWDNQIDVPERKVVTVAVETALDPLKRTTIGSGNGVGLRAGTFQSVIDADGNQTTTLQRLRVRQRWDCEWSGHLG